MNGQLEVLKWARENGCPWDSDKHAERNYFSDWSGQNETFAANYIWLKKICQK